jgi:hypothetical protein
MEGKSFKKIWLINVIFGSIVGSVYGILSWFVYWFPVRNMEDQFAILVAPIIILIYACIVGSTALLWGWIVQLYARALIFKQNQ